MGLPDAKGDVLVKELRAIYPALPIVISSGYDKAAIRSKFAGVQLIDFLTKPYTEDELRDALRRVGIGSPTSAA
jgi:FixJ family two-component response regulator